MKREMEEPTVGEDGRETHPAWAVIGASRVSTMGGTHGGRTLFDSDLAHHHYVVVRLERASRRRDLGRDWIHGESRPVIEVSMSEAQWASFVSSMNTTGVPCTLDWTEAGRMPNFPHEPRLRESIAEVRAAASKSMEEVAAAQAAVDEAFERGAGRKEMRELLGKLGSTVRNAPSNMAFAGDSLTRHAENVVQRARADVEAMVARHAQTVGTVSGPWWPFGAAVHRCGRCLGSDELYQTTSVTVTAPLMENGELDLDAGERTEMEPIEMGDIVCDRCGAELTEPEVLSPEGRYVAVVT